MIGRTMLQVVLSAVTAGTAFAQPGSVRDCLPLLATDYYSYSAQSSLQEDFIRYIDFQAWEELRRSGIRDGQLSLFDIAELSFNDSYDEFQKKRQSYLDRQQYRRTTEQAVDILAVTTSSRAYESYDKCMRTLSSQTGVIVWASRETVNEIDLRVLYRNPPDRRGVTIDGYVSGGSVDGEEAGKLWGRSYWYDWLPWRWNTAGYWRGNEEKSFIIRRASGTPVTTVTVRPADGSSPISLEFPRADAVLTLTYEGEAVVPRRSNVTVHKRTPNNHENRGQCANEVGRTSTGICISRTDLVLSTQSPRFFSNMRRSCDGVGCPWSREGPVVESEDRSRVSTYWDNWGSGINVTLTADEFERMSKANCGPEDRVPVIRSRPVVFTTSADCKQLAVISWRDLRNGSQGVVRFGDEKDSVGYILRESVVSDVNGVSIASYKVAH